MMQMTFGGFEMSFRDRVGGRHCFVCVVCPVPPRQKESREIKEEFNRGCPLSDPLSHFYEQVVTGVSDILLWRLSLIIFYWWNFVAES